jgi:hypothetical protein
MKKPVCIILFSICILSLFSCGVVKGKGEAEKVAEFLFNERIQNGWDGTDKYYSDLFWKNTTDKKWHNIRKLVTKAMGELKSFSLTTWNIQSKVNTNEISGTLVRLVYETVYDKGKGTETLVVHKPLMGEKFAILSHNINSELIQQLIEKGIEQAASGDGA